MTEVPFPPGVVPVRPACRLPDDRCLYFQCCGPSMSPTLKAGDLIAVAAYGSRPVRRGDIVVFRLQPDGRLIAHRVLSAGGGRFRMQGDNNNLRDPWSPSLKDIVGRVVRRERGRKTRAFSGGAAGALCGGARRVRAAVRRVLFRMFRPVYLWAAERGIVRRLLPFRLQTRILAVKRPGGMELQLLAGRVLIARRPAASGTWHVRRPFKLLVDVRGLASISGDAENDDIIKK
ncbi:MAG: hypothetical protein FJY83_08840 [Candidatus Aminicenantes bacterium]|nr:hypothetical protein [Candidatus Aminicenantes bacterium]